MDLKGNLQLFHKTYLGTKISKYDSGVDYLGKGKLLMTSKDGNI